MLVVLDGSSLSDALTLDPDGVRETLVKICDQIVYSSRILDEYVKVTAFSNLQAELEKLKVMRPRKAEERRPGPVGRIRGLRSQHRVFVEDSIGLEAHYFVTRNPLWQRDRIELPRGCELEMVTPAQYVSRRRQNI